MTTAQPSYSAAPPPLPRTETDKGSKNRSMPVVYAENRSTSNTPASRLPFGLELPAFFNNHSMGRIIALLGLFLLFFLIVSFFIVRSHQATETNSAKAVIQGELGHQITQTADTLDAQLSWINNAVSVNTNPTQLINMVSRGSGIIAAALLNGQGNIIKGTSNADPLSSVSLDGFPQSGVLINSLIATDGTVTPVIVRKVNNAYLVIALAPGTLSGFGEGSFAVIDGNGRVIDGPKKMGQLGAAEHYKLRADRLSSLLRSEAPTTISP